jgi:hypothetical protein
MGRPPFLQDFRTSFFCFLTATTAGDVILQFWVRNELNSQRSGRSCFLGVWKELNGDGRCSCFVNLGRGLVIGDSMPLLLAEEIDDGAFVL